VARTLSKYPEDRYGSMIEFAHALRQAVPISHHHQLTGSDQQVTKPIRLPRLRRPAPNRTLPAASTKSKPRQLGRSRWLAFLAGAALVAGLFQMKVALGRLGNPKANLVVVSRPTGAAVIIDGVATKQVTPISIPMSTGRHDL